MEGRKNAVDCVGNIEEYVKGNAIVLFVCLCCFVISRLLIWSVLRSFVR